MIGGKRKENKMAAANTAPNGLHKQIGRQLQLVISVKILVFRQSRI